MESDEFTMNTEQIEKAIQQDQAALNELYQTYYPCAMKKALSLTHNYADAQDIVQDTFLQLHMSLSKLKDPSSFKSWFYKIIHSKCINLFYRNRKLCSTDPSHMEILCDYEETRVYMLPRQAMILQYEKEQVYRSIQALKPLEQEVMLLTYLCDLKLEEAAQILKIPLGTVKTRRHKAKQHMKHYMIKQDIYSSF